MTEPKIGLALGAGAAKGIAQIGVIKVLLKNNIKIDYIAGASAGSIVGAYLASYGDIDGLEKMIVSLTRKDTIGLFDLIIPNKGLVNGKKAMDYLMKHIGDKEFSDLKIPLRIIATDMADGSEAIFESGSIRDAIRASISLPGIFTPAKIGNRYYLDGGIVNPTPIDAVKNMGADIVIAVDHTFMDAVEPKNPTILDTMMRSYDISRTHIVKLKCGDIDKNVVLVCVRRKDLAQAYQFYNEAFIKEGEDAMERSMEKLEKSLVGWSGQ